MTVTHHEKILREFTKQARTFADPQLNQVFTGRLTGLVKFVEPELDTGDVCLEVACGTGLVARALSRRVRHVTALDATPAMLEQGKREADREGVTNVTFARGDAGELPFLDRSFTLVITRFSLHHFEKPLVALREMVRVSRSGASLIIADLVRTDAPGDPDRHERLRDPSHASLLTVQQMTELLTEVGAEVKRSTAFEVVRPVDAWLAQSHTPEDAAARVRAELKAELDGGAVTGMRPVMADGELCFTQAQAYLAAIAS
ncbi:class I SAM-dependent methyltransferase [Actinomadura sp. HBU206391]|uniref:class I SAM-dependent methyltransferase n=1 Tax=Actinomadura sp. HBU206391 TaxID=2731692 RepID=UPI00164EFFF3|nr:methyltransferase domain-containing protein [Actinomadura sp. HBU206391]MBC6459784.1 methyltransferase domain-containing protein [Actinomadura sp. HBU206391]